MNDRLKSQYFTGEKPYACPVCPRAFNQRVVLREHIRSHHSGPDASLGSTAAPYACSVCGDTFPLPVKLIQHLIEHSDTNTAMSRQPAVSSLSVQYKTICNLFAKFLFIMDSITFP